MTEPVEIFVALLDEGVTCWRPVLAVPLGDAAFQIVSDQTVPDDEKWAFAPGDSVTCEERTFSDGVRGLIAVRMRQVDG